MKLITLNTWGGQLAKELEAFIKNQSDTGIFCFQEVFNNASKVNIDPGSALSLVNLTNISKDFFQDIERWLPNHRGFFVDLFDNLYGLAIFVKKDLAVIDHGEVLVYENPNFPDPEHADADHNRKLQWIKINLDNKEYYIMNVHGHWTGVDKNDNPARLEQSTRIKKFVDSVSGEKILCGDFNLNPNIESVAILDEGMVNLIKTNNVTSTRTSLYTKEAKFADYIFVTPTIKVLDFKVLPEEVSDHAALLLEI
ncbi:MAG: endonuclease/exonuclease/phosphatase family protein [Candidatus Vogelbacteria bacterium]|nr:endonuclease/exonuclease/phosphatase family protein [Candidatus Vogelbacteria bacterium]